MFSRCAYRYVTEPIPNWQIGKVGVHFIWPCTEVTKKLSSTYSRWRDDDNVLLRPSSSPQSSAAAATFKSTIHSETPLRRIGNNTKEKGAKSRDFDPKWFRSLNQRCLSLCVCLEQFLVVLFLPSPPLSSRTIPLSSLILLLAPHLINMLHEFCIAVQNS